MDLKINGVSALNFDISEKGEIPEKSFTVANAVNKTEGNVLTFTVVKGAANVKVFVDNETEALTEYADGSGNKYYTVTDMKDCELVYKDDAGVWQKAITKTSSNVDVAGTLSI